MAGDLEKLREKVSSLPHTVAGDKLRELYLQQIAEAQAVLEKNVGINPPLSAGGTRNLTDRYQENNGITRAKPNPHGSPSTNTNSDGESASRPS